MLAAPRSRPKPSAEDTHAPGRGARCRRLAMGLCVAGASLLASACATELSTDPEVQLPGVKLTPAEAPPGAIVVLESTVLGQPRANLAVRIDDHLAPIRWSDDGEALLAVPMLAAGPAGTTPPAGRVAVTIVDDHDEIVARSEGAFTVIAMQPSPGSTDTLLAAFGEISSGIAAFGVGTDADTTEFDVYAGAVLAALDSLLTGPGEESLASRLEELHDSAPETRALLDAVLAQSGLIESTRRWAEAVRGLESVDGASLEQRQAPLAAVELTDSDLDLARRMQFHTVTRLIGETVIGETAAEYGASVGAATGILGIAVSGIPVAGQIGAVLTVADFVLNKVVLGLFPSRLTALDLVLEHDRLSPGDTTFARLDIEARNEPPETTLLGLLDFLSATGNLGGNASDLELRQFREALEKLAEYVQDKIEGALIRFAMDDLGLNIDPSFSVVPELVWTSVALNPRLFDLQTHTPDIIVPVDGELNWHAAGPTQGEGRIYARTAIGDDAVLIDLPPGLTYTGGAFGEEVVGTETRSVFVQGDLVLEVDFTDTLQDDDVAALEVRAGHLGVDDEPIWEPGIDIQLLVDGGTVADESGVTDADGQFITLAQLLPGSDRIIITVVASDALGSEVVSTVEAISVSGDASVVILGGGVEATANYSVIVGEYGDGYAPLRSNDRDGDGSVVDGQGSWSVFAQSGDDLSHPHTGDEASASAEASIQLEIQIPAGGDHVATFAGNAQVSAQADASRNDNYNGASAGASARNLNIRFEVVGGPVHYELSSNFDGTPASVSFVGEFPATGTLPEGDYTLWIRDFSCSTSSQGEGECSASYDFSLVLTR